MAETSKRELEEADKKFRGCLRGVINNSPFYGMSIAEMEVVCDTNCKTMWTDGKRMGYSPEYVKEKPEWLVSLTLEHEAEHKNLAHPARSKGKDAKLANIAADMVVNSILAKNGRKIPEDWYYEPAYAEKSFDEIYGILKGKQQEEQEQQKQEQKDEEQEQDDQQGDDPGQDGQGDEEGDQEGQQGDGDGEDFGGAGEIRVPTDEDGNELEDADIQKEIQEAETKTLQYARIAESFGQLGKGSEQVVTMMKEGVIKWKDFIHRFMTKRVRTKYTWSKPRQICGTILPRKAGKELGLIDLYVDTSGSIVEEELNQFASEIATLMKTYNVRCRVIHCDEEVNHVDQFEKGQDIVLTMHGGGGTAFSPAIAWSMKQDEHPIVGIYLTDLDGTDFGKEPDFPVIWIQTKGNRAKVPPFGEVIKMYPGL